MSVFSRHWSTSIASMGMVFGTEVVRDLLPPDVSSNFGERLLSLQKRLGSYFVYSLLLGTCDDPSGGVLDLSSDAIRSGLLASGVDETS